MEKAFETVIVLCLWDPSQWCNLDSSTAVSKNVTCCLETFLCLNWRPRVLFVSFEMIAQIPWCHFATTLKRKNALLNCGCDPWIGSPYSWCFLPHSPFSCCSPFCSFTLKSRISCDRLAILNGMGWEGTKAKLLWHFSLLCACLLRSLKKSNPKDTAKFGYFRSVYLYFPLLPVVNNVWHNLPEVL